MFPPVAGTFSITRNPFSFRLFGPRATCSACNTQIYGNDIIMRKDHETIYHVSCFRCCNCKRNFSVGERCITDRTNGKIFCLDNSCRVYKEKKPRKTKKIVNETFALIWKIHLRERLSTQTFFNEFVKSCYCCPHQSRMFTNMSSLSSKVKLIKDKGNGKNQQIKNGKNQQISVC